MKRVLLNETFKKGVFDTSFIAQNEKELLGEREFSAEDKNKQIAANTTNPNRGLFLQLMGVVLGLVTFVIALAR